jgi:shikimate 5-dehydrogenase
LDGAQAAMDLVYQPGETAWCRACRGLGLRATDGRSMLVAQGVEAFKRFFDVKHPPREVMAAAVNRELNS